MAILFSDGFESGDLTAWTGSQVYDAGTITGGDTHPHHGIYNMKAGNITAALSGGWCWKLLAAPPAEAYMRLYLMMTAVPSLNSGFQNCGPGFAKFATSDWLLYAGLENIAGSLFWGVMHWENPTIYYYEAVASNPVANKWYCVEIYDKIDAVNGIIRMWVDGILKIERTGLDTTQRDTVITYVKSLGVGANQAAPFDLYADDVVVSDEYIELEPVAVLSLTNDMIFRGLPP